MIGIYEAKPGTFFVYLVGIWMAGMRAMPLNMRMPDQVTSACVRKSGCRLVTGSQAEEAKRFECDYLQIVLGESLARADIRPAANPDAIIMFTSGSTGEPKAIPLSFQQIIENAQLTSNATGLMKGDRLLIAMPPYFTSAICHFITCILQEAGMAAITGFNFGEQIISAIKNFNITAFGGSPTNLRRVLGAAKTGKELAGVRIWVSSGDYLTGQEQRLFLERFPEVRLIYIYGLSEVGGRLCINDVRKNPEKIGSPGMPLPGMSVEVVSEKKQECVPPNEVGEIRVSGPLLMSGYLQDSGRVDSCSVKNGFYTGDLGYLDEDGFLWIVGRKDDVFKVGGEKVSIINVEETIRKHLNCKDCCVAIINEQNLGSVLIGLVVPEDAQPSWDMPLLVRNLRSDLPPNAVPVKIFSVDKVPRTGSGKVARKEARSLAYDLMQKK